MDNWDQWSKNIASANQFDTGNIYQNYATAGVTNAAPEAIAGNKAVFESDVDRINKANASALAQKELDAKDPSKARSIMNQDGTYSFYDGAGNKVNINKFAILTGQTPADILKDSDNPEDQKFVNDYNTMKAFASAWVNGDNETLQKLRTADPQKFNELVSSYKTPSDMVNAFKNYYSDYYGSSTTANTQESPVFSVQNLQGTGSDAAGKNVASQISTSPLQQTLTPTTAALPQKSEGFGGFVEGINPWSEYNVKRREYGDLAKSNPWLAYNKYLSGE